MKAGSFEFSLRELAGSMGDYGTLLPFTVGYITVCGINPTGLLVTIGLANVVTGLVYRLPMPIEPMKVLAAMAIAQAWAPAKVYTSAIVMGIVWLFMGATGAMTRIAKWTPRSVVRGIQLSLGVLLAVQGVKMVSTWWLLGLVAIIIVLLLRESRYAPAAIVLMLLGIVLAAARGKLAGMAGPAFSLPSFTRIDLGEVWPVLRDGGLAQIPLTATNAVIATSSLISEYFPGRRVTERQLSFNQGVMNTVIPFFGGMPLCHGSGGLAGQYYFGARTGGTNILEGVTEIALGLFLGGSIAALFSSFPLAIVGAMMLLVGIGLAKFLRDLRFGRELLPVTATVAGSVIFNMAIGFAAGMLCHYLFFRSPQPAPATR
jgi:MFS superfamily sulfate permease-like transporter